MPEASTAWRTLARVTDPTPSPDHSVFWGHWVRELAASRPTLEQVTTPDPSDPTATLTLRSLGGVRLGARCVSPPEGVPVRAGLVVLHGTGPCRTLERDAARWRALAGRGLEVMLVRLRAFPGSRLDTPRQPEGTHWILQGFEPGDDESAGDPESVMKWVLPQVVADAANACRALRNRINGLDGWRDGPPETIPVYLYGESLGAAIAVITAAQLAGKLPDTPIVERLALATPSFADWDWRLAHPPGAGVGRPIQERLDASPNHAERLRSRLRLFDAAIHAHRVRIPALCGLALRDPVTPPETAAAVYNALDSAPGDKWRFVLPQGHGGAARQHAMFRRSLLDFFDPARTPGDAMDAWEDRLYVPAPPLPRAPAGLFGDDLPPNEVDRALITAFEDRAVTLDALPYTDAFELLHRALENVLGKNAPTKADAFKRLHNLRKAGKLPRMGRSGSPAPPKIDPEHERTLLGLVTDAAGSVGARDSLLYTPDFDAIVEAFNARTGHTLTHRDLWRLVARLAK